MMDASIASGNTRYSALEEMFTKELLWWNEHFWCYCGSFLEMKTCLPIRLLQYKDKYLHVAIIQNLLLYFLIPKKNFCVGAGGASLLWAILSIFEAQLGAAATCADGCQVNAGWWSIVEVDGGRTDDGDHDGDDDRTWQWWWRLPWKIMMTMTIKTKTMLVCNRRHMLVEERWFWW